MHLIRPGTGTLSVPDLRPTEEGFTVKNKKIEIVKAAYAAFGQGDISEVMQLLSPDVDWIIAGPVHRIPYAGHHHGRNAVGDR